MLIEIRPNRWIDLTEAAGQAGRDLTVFLAHGAGGNKDQWRFQLKALAEAGIRTVIWDNVGHGASPQPRRRQHYAGTELVADYRAVFERFGTARNILVGHSYGTRLTLAVLLELAAEQRLASVAAALLLGPPPPMANFGDGLFKYIPAFVLEWLRPRFAAGFRDRAWSPTTDPALIDYEERQTHRNTLFMMQALMTQSTRPDPAGFSALTLPIDIIAGADDRLTPPAGAEALAALLPEARFHLIEKSGHQIMLEQPEAVNRLLFQRIGSQ
jgi:abhydrolase domain-containing protein 8